MNMVDFDIEQLLRFHLTLESDWHLISPYNFSPESHIR